MGETGIAHGIVDLLRNAAALTGDQRHSNLALLARQSCPNAGINLGAKVIDRGPSL